MAVKLLELKRPHMSLLMNLHSLVPYITHYLDDERASHIAYGTSWYQNCGRISDILSIHNFCGGRGGPSVQTPDQPLELEGFAREHYTGIHLKPLNLWN